MNGLKMENRCLDFLYEAFGGGSLDWNHLFNEIEDFELEPNELIEFTKDFTSEPTFNDFMYACLYLGSEKMKNVLINYVKDNCNNSDEIEKIIRGYKVKIYCNYLDSGFDDDIFGWYTYKELKDEYNQREMLMALLNKIGVKYDCKSN